MIISDLLIGSRPSVSRICSSYKGCWPVVLLDKVKNDQERLFYIRKAIDNSWSRNVLRLQIKSSF